ncbi:hypothetical protein HPB52_008245 [Rhipicephalus sanguineus]|uniref:Uncharacterized protein n=1 Tax=Rhipicephalus sanguineus TaxID=34632 RepID=A0A9D4PTD6_RHISA|nr:hypothetical protein HPB52_008245 [Rhipicephalus sanguineus]
MHAAVWSQPGRRAKLSTARSVSVEPQATSGKALLAVSVFLAIAGGFLAALGLTGCFVRGQHKLHLGWGIPAGACAMINGIAGSRMASQRCKPSCYVLLCLTACAGCLTMVVLGALALRDEGSSLISVLAATETGLGAIAAGLCSLAVTLAVLSNRRYPTPPRVQSRNVVQQQTP